MDSPDSSAPPPPHILNHHPYLHHQYHVLTFDIVSKIMDFSQQGPRTVCILSATGAVSNVNLHQKTMSATVAYEGRLDIISCRVLSLLGSFITEVKKRTVPASSTPPSHLQDFNSTGTGTSPSSGRSSDSVKENGNMNRTYPNLGVGPMYPMGYSMKNHPTCC